MSHRVKSGEFSSTEFWFRKLKIQWLVGCSFWSNKLIMDNSFDTETPDQHNFAFDFDNPKFIYLANYTLTLFYLWSFVSGSY